MHLTIQDGAEDRMRLVSALQSFAREHALPQSVLQAADLALEEHVANVFEHNDPHGVHIRLTIENQRLQIEVEDDGRAYDPLSRPPVDTSLPPEDRPIGGLGVHLIRRFMDEVDYRREGDKNILRMRKRLG